MISGSAIRVCSIVLVVVLLAAEMTSAAPYNDYDNLRELYEVLLQKEAAAASPRHQMERKGGRSPSLRLRFGRRADPLWHSDMPVDINSN